MNIYIAIAGPVGKALKKVLDTTTNICTFTKQQDDAHVVVVADKAQLMEVYNREQTFVVYSSYAVVGLPENARWVSIVQGFGELLKILYEANEKGGIPKKEADESFFPRRDAEMPATCILVVDDSAENRARAKEQLVDSPLPYNYELRIVGTYADAMRFIGEEDWDVVLTDLYLPVSTFHKSLSVERIQVGQLVPYGFLIAFEAARKGASVVAVVTDANHHQDCLSAAFDDFREPFEFEVLSENGQECKIQFFNHIGKNWKAALDAL